MHLQSNTHPGHTELAGAGAPSAKENEMLRAARVAVPMVAKAPPNRGSIETREALTPLFGACLLSSVGSLPLHLAPLIVATLIADSRASVAGAGWVPSVMLLGQLSTSLALPILRMHHVGRIPAIVAAILLLIGLGISSSADFARALLGWFLVGQCCGVLMYLGTIAASVSSRLVLAFSLRLAIVLILAGSVSGVLQMSAAFISYNDLWSQLVLILVPILVCGLVMYRPAGESRATIENAPGGTWTGGQLSGLAAIYFLFVGLTGFLAYVVQQALTRGMIFEDMVWSIAAMKVATGIWLLGTAMIEKQRRENDRF